MSTVNQTPSCFEAVMLLNALSAKYKLLLASGYHTFNMSMPTLRTTIKATAPDNYELAASRADVENINYWQYDSILMRGDHVILRWHKRGEEWL